MFLLIFFIILTGYFYLRLPKKRRKHTNIHQSLNIRRKLRVSNIENVKWDAVVIGSGPSGLGVANYLSRLDWRVLVLEQNEVLGGGLHTFSKNACTFHSGLHYVGCGTDMINTLNKLTAPEVVEWKDMLPVYDRIRIGDEEVDLKGGEGAWMASMLKIFPDKQTTLEAYLHEVRKVKSTSVRLFFVLKAVNIPHSIRVVLQRLLCKQYFELAGKTVDEVLDRVVGTDTKLRAFLVGQQGDYGLAPDTASWFVHAGVVAHFMDGGMVPVNNSSDIVQKLAKPITDRGGFLFAQADVGEIIVQDGQTKGVVVNGKTINCKVVVSSIGVLPTYNLAQKCPPPSLLSLKESYANSFLFLVFHNCPGTIEHNTWYYENLSTKQPVFFSPLQKQITEGVYTMILISEETPGSERHTETERLKAALFQVFPELEDFLHEEFSGDGKTCEKFLGRVGVYGLSGDCDRFVCKDLQVKVPEVKGLFLTGQDIVTAGFAGAFASAEITANVVSGYGNISSILCGKNLQNAI